MLHRFASPPPALKAALFVSLVLSAITASSRDASAQDLYRLRIDAPVQATANSTVDLSVVADHLSYGANAGAIQAVQFTVVSPPGTMLQGHIAGSDWSIDDALFYSVEQIGPAAVRFVAVFKSPLDELASRRLLGLTLTLPPEATGAISLGIEDSPDADLDGRALFLTTGRGWVVPHRMGCTITVSAAGPAATDPSEATWPAPTEGELVIEYADIESSSPTSASSAAPEGGGAAMGMEGGPPSDLFCQYEPRGSQEEIPPFVDPGDVIEVFSPGTIADIQAAFNLAKSSFTPVMIRIHPGVFTGTQLVLDVTGMANEVIIASYGGPVYKSPWTFPVSNGTTLQFPSTSPPTWAVRVIGTAAPGGILNFGWTKAIDLAPDPPTYSTDDAFNRGWRGFELVGSRGGISIEATCPVRVRGNYLRHATGTGGNSGIYSLNLADLEVFHNEITLWTGSGIFIQYVVSNTTVAKVIRNFIHDNQGVNGGGVRAEGPNLELCNNSIYSNRAISGNSQGGGVYYEFQPDFNYPRGFFARQNLVEFNHANESGAGMHVRAAYNITSEKAPMPEPWNFAIIGNQFRGNGDEASGVGIVGSGGGLFLNAELPALSNGLFEIYPGHEGQLVIGNTFVGNFAELFGAGVLVAAADAPLVFPYVIRFEHNTIAFNEVLAPLPGLFWGWGLTLFDCCQYVVGNGVVIQENRPNPAPDDYNWNAPIGIVNLFSYSRMPDCSPPSSGDILGTPTTNPTSSTLQADFNDLLGHQAATSMATLDSADSALEALYSSNPFLDEDFDRENRVDGPAMDIGADERRIPNFRRGDADGNGSLNIADAIRMLDAQFVPGQPWLDCESAGDANDDEFFNIADAVYLLTYLFSSGTAPPAPHPGCGLDPTPGSLTCQVTPCP